MKIRIYKETTPAEPKYFLRLVEDDGMPAVARLFITDATGERIDSGTILTILADGSCCFPDAISEKGATALGLKLRSNGSMDRN